MGTDKNIKLHIVTDIKICLHHIYLVVVSRDSPVK